MSQTKDTPKRFAALKEGDWFDFAGNDRPKCPHCGADFNIEDNEAWDLYDTNETHEVDCPSCEDTFQVNSSTSWSFSTDEQEDDE